LTNADEPQIRHGLKKPTDEGGGGLLQSVGIELSEILCGL
jgi:hypothetical protein